VSPNSGGHGCDTGKVVDDVERQARSHDRRATLPQKQPVKRLVERDDQHQQPR
jgi:hypothetical protein